MAGQTSNDSNLTKVNEIAIGFIQFVGKTKG